MSKVIVQPGQTLEDIAVQWLGSEELVFELARLNDLSYTADLIAGQEIELPEVYNKRVKRVYDLKGYQPATNDKTDECGIDYWIIEVDFEVQP